MASLFIGSVHCRGQPSLDGCVGYERYRRYRADEILNLEASRFVHDVDCHVSATLAYRVILTRCHPAWLADVETVVV